MDGVKFEDETNAKVNLVLFKDMIDNIFIKVTLSHLKDYVLIERINKERVLKLSG